MDYKKLAELLYPNAKDIKYYEKLYPERDLKEGAEVVHVDSSRGMIDWAKENVRSNDLENAPIRFLVDDDSVDIIISAATFL